MKIKIVIPAFNDWTALQALIPRISELANGGNDISLLVVNDCSTQPMPPAFQHLGRLSLQVLHLNRNIGHQRAIAIGISWAFHNSEFEYLIVMDADGEDKAEDISALLDACVSQKDRIIFARRTRRYEGPLFVFFYSIYKSIFRLLTGTKIEFGNFCIIPKRSLKTLVHVSEIWNHFSGGIIKSKLQYSSIPLERGRRIAGESKMNFTSLIIHGMSAVSVHIETVAVRLLIFSVALISIAVAGIITVSAIRLFTPLAIPGWASFLVLSFSILIFQAFLISLFLLFVVLTYRTQKHFIPARDYNEFVAEIETIA